MNAIREYRPAFVCAEDPLALVEFETEAELLAVPFVAQWARAEDRPMDDGLRQ